uniref:Uncharacterized protein n=1 Tax=mine drainage metagenome TaxID=410659 RepID=E6QKA4_9ZZZZ
MTSTSTEGYFGVAGVTFSYWNGPKLVSVVARRCLRP